MTQPLQRFISWQHDCLKLQRWLSKARQKGRLVDHLARSEDAHIRLKLVFGSQWSSCRTDSSSDEEAAGILILMREATDGSEQSVIVRTVYVSSMSEIF